MTAPESKTCSKCGETKPLTEFYVHRDCVDGRRPDCAECCRQRTRNWQAANSERAKDFYRERYAKNPEVYKQRSRARYAAKREEIRERARAYNLANPEVTRRAAAKRKARKAGVEHKPYTRREIYDRDGGICRGCKKELAFERHGFEIDHIVPISLGGPDTPANVQLMCRPCNREKWNKLEGQIHFAV